MLQIAVMWLLQWKKAGGFDYVNDQTSNNCDFTVFRFWWLKINALGEIGDWVELEKFSKGKKAPVGMEVCFHVNIIKLGVKFLS